ncbi:unnamed protein product [Pleuronectes platessa]|uniref:Uncharacterized protein n=1 Tax=Pleuronectes platessa TaxID=8262 RepID=A0A9N7UKT2_PLEPL|nr:unnamed protein product [Pleuronectes platessa]
MERKASMVNNKKSMVIHAQRYAKEWWVSVGCQNKAMAQTQGAEVAVDTWQSREAEGYNRRNVNGQGQPNEDPTEKSEAAVCRRAKQQLQLAAPQPVTYAGSYTEFRPDSPDQVGDKQTPDDRGAEGRQTLRRGSWARLCDWGYAG